MRSIPFADASVFSGITVSNRTPPLMLHGDLSRAGEYQPSDLRGPVRGLVLGLARGVTVPDADSSVIEAERQKPAVRGDRNRGQRACRCRDLTVGGSRRVKCVEPAVIAPGDDQPRALPAAANRPPEATCLHARLSIQILGFWGDSRVSQR